MKRNEHKSLAVKEKFEIIYYMKQKGTTVVHDEKEQRLIAVAVKLERYDKRTSQFKQNRLLESNQKSLLMN